MPSSPLRIINARAPIRICDNGGWTDTWFAEYGAIFNIAVAPYAEVEIAVYPRVARPEQVALHIANFGDDYGFNLEDLSEWRKHPLLEAAIRRMGIPSNLAVEIKLHSEAPPGGSIGTSAAVTVALLGALDALKGSHMSRHAVAETAQAVETQDLGLQCGIQDQLCAAYGGINFIEMKRYPHATVDQLHLPSTLLHSLEKRLMLIYLGKAHHSSGVHEKVIAQLEAAGAEAPQLAALRATAPQSRDALLTGDFAALGRAMIENTQAQANLHPALISPEAARLIAIARSHGALGWKVNGAGGDGGSLTLLCGSPQGARRALRQAIQKESPVFSEISIQLDSHGLRVWEGN